MGAIDITAVAAETADCQEAFQQLQDEARYQYGADSYNGSLSTIAGYRQSADYWRPIPVSCLPWVESEIWERRRQGEIPEIVKWESCLALPLASDQSFTWAEQRVELEISSEQRDYPDYALRQALRQLLSHGALVGSISWERLSAGQAEIIESSESGLGSGGFAVFSPERRKLHGEIVDSRQQAIDHAAALAESSGKTLEVVELRPAGYSCQRQAGQDSYRVTYRQPEPNSDIATSGWAFIGLAAS